MSTASPIQVWGKMLELRALLRPETAIVLAAIVSVVALAWSYLVLHDSGMDMVSAGHMAMGMAPGPWTAAQFGLTFLMWAVMMVAMMLPSALPMVLTYAAIVRRAVKSQSLTTSTALFTFGYVLVWSGFSIGATLLQYGLDRLALLSSTLVASSTILGGSLFVVAGLYQWAPLKEFCLKHCQIPLAFVARHWRSGRAGALRMGIRHGVYCVGCCWALMLLLFVGGIMNLLWVAAIAVFVLIEKLGWRTRVVRWISGAGLVAGGGVLMMGFNGL